MTDRLEKFAQILGYLPDKSVSTALLAGKSLNEYFGHVPLASLLPYESFDEVNEIYYNENNIGIVLEIAPLIGANEETVKLLNSIITDSLPEGAISQWLLWASPKIAAGLETWVTHRSQRGGWFEKMAGERCEHLMQGTYKSLIDSTHYRLRNFRCFVSVTLPLDENEIIKLVRCRDSIKNTLSGLGSMADIIRPHAFLSLLYDMVNPCFVSSGATKRWEQDRSLAAQLVSPETRLVIQPDSLLLADDVRVTSFSVEELPERWLQHDNSELIGSDSNSHLHPQGEFFINAVIRAIPHDSATKRAFVKGTRARQQAESKLARFMPRAKKINQDWQYANERIDDGDKMIEIYYNVVCYSKKDEMADAGDAIKSLFRAKGWKLKQDKYIPLQSWLALLPMRVDVALFEDLKAFNRTRTILSFNAANLLPLQGEWKGDGSPCMLLFGRRGQICWWDPFANREGNYNIAVTGKSRSGKSVFLQDLAAGIVGSGGRVFIFDIGRSFEKSCKYLSGEFIEFHPDMPICINPFSTIDKFDEALELLLPLFAQMTSSKRDLDDLETSYLEQALRHTWSAYGQQSNATQVADWLTHHADPRAIDLGTMLYPYTSAGRYGRYFNGECSLDFSNPYLVLELEELKVKKDLQNVVLMVLMYHVTECMYRGNRKQKIMCIIDEAWDLMEGKLGGQFMEVGYRRAAKYKGSFASGTQTLEDYDKSPASRAAKANADSMVILAQKPDAIEIAAENKLIDDNPHFKKTLKSVKTKENIYA
ncbi:MAG: type IV secretion system protein TraC, partial [Gammaproteobacteria bacterium]